jgi:putative hemolysin
MNESALNQFKAKVIFTIDCEDFIIKTAFTLEDLKQALKLRHQVFLEEGLNQNHITGLEFDDFDNKADHLLIINKSNNEAVGTYRLLFSEFTAKFYSQNEFYLDDFLKIPGNKLELGRACTHIEYRTGRTMDLLWQGLSRYIRETKTQFLFGCSSVKSIIPEEIFSVTKSLFEKDNLVFDYNIKPIGNFIFENSEEHFNKAIQDIKILRSLPPLLRSYLHAGAKVYGMPARDLDFNCSDMFTILNLHNLNKKFAERYNPLGEENKQINLPIKS